MIEKGRKPFSCMFKAKLFKTAFLLEKKILQAKMRKSSDVIVYHQNPVIK